MRAMPKRSLKLRRMSGRKPFPEIAAKGGRNGAGCDDHAFRAEIFQGSAGAEQNSFDLFSADDHGDKCVRVDRGGRW